MKAQRVLIAVLAILVIAGTITGCGYRIGRGEKVQRWMTGTVLNKSNYTLYVHLGPYPEIILSPGAESDTLTMPVGVHYYWVEAFRDNKDGNTDYRRVDLRSEVDPIPKNAISPNFGIVDFVFEAENNDIARKGRQIDRNYNY